MTLIQDDAAPRLSLPRLHLIVDPALCREYGIAPSALAARAVADGRAVAVHLREPNAAAAALWRLAVELRAVIAPPARLIINDRADVAVAVGADGVHLGGHGLPVAAARHVVGPRLLLGRSVHSVAEARTAEREGADYALLGTIYPTASHPGVVGAGPALVRAACAAVCSPSSRSVVSTRRPSVRCWTRGPTAWPCSGQSAWRPILAERSRRSMRASRAIGGTMVSCPYLGRAGRG